MSIINKEQGIIEYDGTSSILKRLNNNNEYETLYPQEKAMGVEYNDNTLQKTTHDNMSMHINLKSSNVDSALNEVEKRISIAGRRFEDVTLDGDYRNLCVYKLGGIACDDCGNYLMILQYYNFRYTTVYAISKDGINFTTLGRFDDEMVYDIVFWNGYFYVIKYDFQGGVNSHKLVIKRFKLTTSILNEQRPITDISKLYQSKEYGFGETTASYFSPLSFIGAQLATNGNGVWGVGLIKISHQVTLRVVHLDAISEITSGITHSVGDTAPYNINMRAILLGRDVLVIGNSVYAYMCQITNDVPNPIKIYTYTYTSNNANRICGYDPTNNYIYVDFKNYGDYYDGKLYALHLSSIKNTTEIYTTFVSEFPHEGSSSGTMFYVNGKYIWIMNGDNLLTSLYSPSPYINGSYFPFISKYIKFPHSNITSALTYGTNSPIQPVKVSGAKTINNKLYLNSSYIYVNYVNAYDEHGIVCCDCSDSNLIFDNIDYMFTTIYSGDTSSTININNLITYQAFDAETGRDVEVNATYADGSATFEIFNQYENDIIVKCTYYNSEE